MRVVDCIDGETLAIVKRNSPMAVQAMSSSPARKDSRVAARTLPLLVALIVGAGVWRPEAASGEPQPVPADALVTAINPAGSADVLRPAPPSIFAGSRVKTADLAQGAGSPRGAGAQAGEVVVTQIGGHIFHIPQGYVSTFLGYAGYVQIQTLLPCLLPETPENTAEFHTNTWGKRVIATLSKWDYHNLTGAQWLGVLIQDSLFAKLKNESMKDKTIFIRQIGRTDLFWLKNLFAYGGSDIFVRVGSEPLFLFECAAHREDPWPYFPSCSVREKMWGDVLLEYRYDRSFIDEDVENGIKIDERLHGLLESFMTTTPVNNKMQQGGTCK